MEEVDPKPLVVAVAVVVGVVEEVVRSSWEEEVEAGVELLTRFSSERVCLRLWLSFTCTAAVSRFSTSSTST